MRKTSDFKFSNASSRGYYSPQYWGPPEPLNVLAGPAPPPPRHTSSFAPRFSSFWALLVLEVPPSSQVVYSIPYARKVGLHRKSSSILLQETPKT